MKLHISYILRIHLIIFTALGYCNVSLNNNPQRSRLIERLLTLWSWLLLIVFNIVAFISLTSDDAYMFTNDKFGYFNDILKVVFGDIAVTATYLEAIFKRTDYYKFWNIYDSLQKNSWENSKAITLGDIRENIRFLLLFYINIILETVLMIIFVILQPMTRHLILFWSIFTPFICAVHLRNMQFIFYIEIIRLELVKLQQDLSLMVDYSRFVAYGCGFRGFEEFMRKKLLDKQKHYQMIYEMFEHFQNAFGVSIIAVLLMVYVRVLVDAYFAYYTVYRDWNKTGKVLRLKRDQNLRIS